MEFMRLIKKLERQKDKRIKSITVTPTISGCTGEIHVTDMQLQEGNSPTGYTLETKMLSKKTDGGNAVPSIFFNGIIRENAIIIYPNTGTETTGLDCYIYPQHFIQGGNMSISHINGAQKATFTEDVQAGEEIAFLASSRRCMRDRKPLKKEGFYQYSAAGDNRHIINLGEGKRANIIVELQEMQRESEMKL